MKPRMEVVEVRAEGWWELEGPGSAVALLGELRPGPGPLLAAGTRTGHLALFSLRPPDPETDVGVPAGPPGSWPALATASGLGPVAALSSGDLFNTGRPALVVVSADGVVSAHRLASQAPASAGLALRPVFRQFVPSNVQAAVVGDVDGDGETEVLVALTDRILRSFRYSAEEASGGGLVALNKWEVPAQLTALALGERLAAADGSEAGGAGEARRGSTLVLSQPHGRHVRLLVHPASEHCPSPPPGDEQRVSDVHFVPSTDLPVSDPLTTVFLPPRPSQLFLFASLVTDVVLLREPAEDLPDRLVSLPKPAIGLKVVETASERVLVGVSECGAVMAYSLHNDSVSPQGVVGLGEAGGGGVVGMDAWSDGTRLFLALLNARSELHLLSMDLHSVL